MKTHFSYGEFGKWKYLRKPAQSNVYIVGEMGRLHDLLWCDHGFNGKF